MRSYSSLALVLVLVAASLSMSAEQAPGPAKPKQNPSVTHAAAVFEGQLPEVVMPADRAFVHPGLLNTQQELDFVRKRLKAGEEPWIGALEKMKAHRFCQLSWEPKPQEHVSQGPYGKPDIGGHRLVTDSSAAYGHAALWCLTGEKAHAEKAVAIVNALSATVKSVSGDSNQGKVLVGWAGCKLASAGELLRHYRQPDGSKSGFTEEDAARLGELFRNVFYPVIQDFQPTFNGNWDTSMMVTMASMAVYLEDRDMLNRALKHYLNSESKGRLVHYIHPGSGQCQETMRDQAHTQMGLGAMTALCKVAESQGLDLWSAADNRLALGMEYTARYNLGYEVPCTGEPGADGRGKWMSVWELAYQHYAIEKGLPMPNVTEVIGKYRPAGSSDLVFEAWGTLLHYRGPETGKGE